MRVKRPDETEAASVMNFNDLPEDEEEEETHTDKGEEEEQVSPAEDDPAYQLPDEEERKSEGDARPSSKKDHGKRKRTLKVSSKKNIRKASVHLPECF